MMPNRSFRRGRWAARSLTLVAGLTALVVLGSTSANACWDGSGAPPFLRTAPTGTPIDAPAKGTIWPCPVYGIPATQITLAETPWVQDNDNKVVLSKIPTVPGAVRMKSAFTIMQSTTTPTTRRLTGNGIPDHRIGTFPIPRRSAAYKYYEALPAEGYANAAEIPVAPYRLRVDLPRRPKMSAQPHCIPDLLTGVALTGAVWHIEAAPDSLLNIYDPNAALPTDRCFGHPYNTEYHYHGYSWKCMKQGKPGKRSPLLGYAMDGFGVYGPRGVNGKVITNAQLDECHGRVGRVRFNGKMQRIYHYVLNNEYPYSIGCFRGKPHMPADTAPTTAMPTAQ